jgi:hypothetical protein
LADRFDRKHLFIQERLVNGTTGRALELRMSPERGGAVSLSIYESVQRASDQSRTASAGHGPPSDAATVNRTPEDPYVVKQLVAWLKKLPFPAAFLVFFVFYYAVQIFIIPVIAHLFAELVGLLLLLVAWPVFKLIPLLTQIVILTWSRVRLLTALSRRSAAEAGQSRLQEPKRCSTTWTVSSNGVVNCHGSAFGEPGCR